MKSEPLYLKIKVFFLNLIDWNSEYVDKQNQSGMETKTEMKILRRRKELPSKPTRQRFQLILNPLKYFNLMVNDIARNLRDNLQKPISICCVCVCVNDFCNW